MTRRAAAVAAVLLLGLLLWWTFHASIESEASAGAPVSAPASPSLPQAVAPRLSGKASLRAPATEASSALPTAAAPGSLAEGSVSTAATGAPVWDLCGVGRLPVPRGAAASLNPERALAALPPHLGRDALAGGYLMLFAALDAGPPRWRAAAVMLRGSDAAGRPQAVALPELARATDDPVVAMWAQQRCDLGASCLAAAERWARVEAANLAPWAALLALQPQRRDELIARMAAAKRFDRHEHALSQTVLEAMPAPVASYLQPALWIEVIGVEAAMSMPGFNGLFDHCREPLVPGSERLQACAAIARTLVERSDGWIGVRLGLRLAERSYLGKSEAAAGRQALEELLRQQVDFLDRTQPLSCAGVARIRAMVEQRARLGELGALRAFAAQRAASAASGPR